MTASKVSMAVAQQLGILYLANLSWYSNNNINRLGDYDLAVSNSQGYYYSDFTTYGPFGNGIPSNSYPLHPYTPGIIAIWQGFAQHLSHTIANRIYGTGEASFTLQGKTWTSSTTSASAKFLEGFDPQRYLQAIILAGFLSV